MSVLVLGPSLDSVDETPVTPPPPATPNRIPIAFRDPASSIGGIVHLMSTQTGLGTSTGQPIRAYAVYIPKGQEAALVAAADPQGFLNSGFPKGSVDVSPANAPSFDITVPGVTPGLYFVQTVAEYQF